MANFGLKFQIGVTSSPVQTTQILNAVGATLGVVLRPQVGKTIAEIGVYCSAVTSPQAFEVRLETVGTTGNPSGTLIVPDTGSGGSRCAGFTPAATTMYWRTLQQQYTVQAGDRVAAMIAYSSGAALSATNNATFNFRGISQTLDGIPSTQYYNGSTWASQNNQSCVAIKYTDGSVDTTSAAVISAVSVTVKDDTTVDEIGVEFTAPISGFINTINFPVRLNSGTATGKVRIYDSAGVLITNDAENSLDAGPDSLSTSAFSIMGLRQSSGVFIRRGEVYTIAWRSTNAQSTIVAVWTAADAASAESFMGFPVGYKTRQNDGEWSAVNNVKGFGFNLVLSEGPSDGVKGNCSSGGICS